jgi:hypothetical protein
MSNVVISIKALDEASSVFDSIKVGLSGLSTTVSQISPTLGSLMQGFAAGGPIGLAVASIGSLVTGLKNCVTEATNAQEVWNKLKASVENSGKTWTDVEGKIKTFIEQLTKVSTFDDEDIAGALKTLVDYGMKLDTALGTLNTTMDLAKGKQVSLNEAATAVGKAFSGQEGILTRMGVVVDETVPKAERFATAMKTIGEKFGGSASADLETYAGKWTLFQNKMNELSEKIGNSLLPFLTKLATFAIDVIDKVTYIFDKIKELCDGFTKWLVGSSWIQDLIAKVVSVLGSLGTDIVKAFSKIWDDVVNAAGTAWNRINKAVSDGVDIVKSTVTSLWKALTGGSIWTDMWNDMIELTQRGMSTITEEVASNMKALQASIAQATFMDTMKNKMASAAASTQSLNTALANMVPKMQPIRDITTSSFDQMAAVTKDAGLSVQTLNECMGNIAPTAKTVDEVFLALKTQFENNEISLEELDKKFTSLSMTLEAQKANAAEFTNAWSSMFSHMNDVAADSLGRIQSMAQATAAALRDVISSLSRELVGGSIWPDMWKDMIGQTASGFVQILSETQRGVGDFKNMFAGTVGGLSVSAMRPLGSAGESASAGGPPPPIQHMTVPITINVQHMTGEVKDLENLTRMICRELGSTVKWRT